MNDAKKDGNRVTTIIAVSSIDLKTPIVVAVNPSTLAVIVEIAP